MFKNIVMALFLMLPQLVSAQAKETNIHASTTIGNQSRFEIVQSPLAARWTFRLDRVCGHVGQLVSTKNGGVTWENMLIMALPNCQQDGKIRYQIFSSGIAARYTFLMNTETGKTWQIRSAKDPNGTEVSTWFLFE